MTELKNVNREMKETREESEKLLTRSIPRVSAAIESSEDRVAKSEDSETFRIETKQLAHLMTEKTELTYNLR